MSTHILVEFLNTQGSNIRQIFPCCHVSKTSFQISKGEDGPEWIFFYKTLKNQIRKRLTNLEDNSMDKEWGTLPYSSRPGT